MTSKHGPGSLRRRAMLREDAVSRGLAIGRSRQWPALSESNEWRAKGLEDDFWKGVDRGRKARANLEQLALELT